MQKCIFLLFALLSMYTTAAQQDSLSFQPSYAIGMHYGQSWNTVNFAPTVNQNTFPGSRIGATFRYISDPNLGIQLELSYDQRGWTEQVDTFGNVYKRAVNYFEFGAFSHITIGKRNFKPLFLLGVFGGVPLNDQETIPAALDPTTKTRYDAALPKRFQYGLGGGIGFDWSLGKLSFQVNGRYRYVMSNLFASGTDNLTFSQMKGFVVQGSLLFNL